MKVLVFIFVLVLVSCKENNGTNPTWLSLSEKVKNLTHKYQLTQSGFDTECIHFKGDLARVISSTLRELLPGERFDVNEVFSKYSTQFVAIVSHNNKKVIEISADTSSD